MWGAGEMVVSPGEWCLPSAWVHTIRSLSRLHHTEGWGRKPGDLLVTPLQGQHLEAPATAREEKQPMGKRSKPSAKPTQCWVLAAAERWPEGERACPTNPSWAGKALPLPGSPWEAFRSVRAPSSPPCPWQWWLTTLNTGLSKPWSLAGAGDAGSSRRCQGWGGRRTGNLGRAGHHHPLPSHPCSSPGSNPASLGGGWENRQGQSVRLVLEWDISTLS